MAERLTLTVPVTPTGPQIRDYAVWALYLGRGEGIILITVEDNNLVRRTYRYSDGEDAQGNSAPGTTLVTTRLRALNRMNLSTNSLEKRLLEQLIADGRLVGSVTGTPD